jgi:Putative Ig domain/Immunoglobulin I-set domain
VQWQVSTNGGTTFTNIAGATSPSYTFTTAAGQSGNQYRAVFTNSVGSANSSAATLTFDTAPVVTTQPAGVSVTAGQPASFSAAASGSPAPTVQWQLSTNAGATFTNIAGATTGTYNLSTTTLTENNDRYRAVFTNPAGSATSNPATLTVSLPPLTITTTSLPTGSVYSKSNKATYQVQLAASGGNPPYKWALQSGSLPTGLKLSAKGVIKGKATFSGTFTFTVRVLDTKTKTKPKTQNLATQQLSITIN